MEGKTEIFTFGHGAYKIEDFLEMTEILDFVVDIRKSPWSKYHPQFNRPNLESILKAKYVFGGDSLGGSHSFHGNLIEYVSKRMYLDCRKNVDGSMNFLTRTISEYDRETIARLPNDRDRKTYIVGKYLRDQIPENQNIAAIGFLREFLMENHGKKIGFFCSEKEKLHCHRHHILSEEWLESLGVSMRDIQEIFPKNERVFGCENKQISLSFD